MNRVAWLLGVIAITSVVPFLMKNCSQGHGELIDGNMPAIRTLIEQRYQYASCVIANEDFRVPTHDEPTGPFNGQDIGNYSRRCRQCQELVDAGLMTVKEEESTNQNDGAQQGRRFELTPLGNELYSEEVQTVEASKLHYVRWRFCLGKAKFHRIDEAGNPFWLGGNRYVRIKFTLELQDPHPFLYDAKSKPLGLEVPSKGRPALLEPTETSVEFFSNGDIDLRGDVS